MTLSSLCDFLAEKAPVILPNPVASFGGKGEKDALQLSGECLVMDPAGLCLLIVLMLTIDYNFF